MRNARFKLTGDTESKFAQVERFMGHLNRRSVKVAEVVTPPLPMSNYVAVPDADCAVFRALIVTNGKIGKAYVYIGRIEKDSNPVVEVEIIGLSSSSSYTFKPEHGLAGYQGELPVKIGDRITVRVRYVQNMNRPETPSIGEIWTGLVFYAEEGTGNKEKILLDTLLEEVEKDEGI